MQPCLQLVLCGSTVCLLLGEQSVSSWEHSLSPPESTVCLLLGAQSVSSWEHSLSPPGSQVFLRRPSVLGGSRWSGTLPRCSLRDKGTKSSQFTLLLGGLFPMCQILFFLFSYCWLWCVGQSPRTRRLRDTFLGVTLCG